MATDRRGFLVGALGVAGVGLLAACGAPESTGPEKATRTVAHPLGSSEVPIAPTRIAVLDRRGTLPALLSLGVTPTAVFSHQAISGTDVPEIFADRLGDVVTIPNEGSEATSNLEVLAAQKPDLILAWSDGITDIYDTLSGIAPTVGIEIDIADTSVAVRSVAAALGKEADADAVVKTFDDSVAALGRELSVEGGVAVLLGIGDNQFRVYQPGAVAICTVLTQLGATVGPDAEALGRKDEGGLVLIGPELLTRIDSDRIVLLSNSGAEGESALKEIESAPLWPKVPAVKAGRVIRLNSQEAVGNYGYPGLEAALADLKEQWS